MTEAWRMPSFTKQMLMAAATLFLALGLTIVQVSNAQAGRRDGRIIAGVIAGVAVAAILARKHRRRYRRYRRCRRYGYYGRRHCYRRGYYKRRWRRGRGWRRGPRWRLRRFYGRRW